MRKCTGSERQGRACTAFQWAQGGHQGSSGLCVCVCVCGLYLDVGNPLRDARRGRVERRVVVSAAAKRSAEQRQADRSRTQRPVNLRDQLGRDRHHRRAINGRPQHTPPLSGGDWRRSSDGSGSDGGGGGASVTQPYGRASQPLPWHCRRLAT